MQLRARALIAVVVATLVSTAAAPAPGRLVLLGGGPTPPEVFTRALELSGGRSARVAVLPHTYPNDSIADAAVELWKEFGVRVVVKVSRTDADAARAAVDNATLVWIPGGFQGQFMKAIAGTSLPEAIRRRWAQGATIGGPSAGAAAVSRVMIADETAPDGASVSGPATMEGLGLLGLAIVSPHFTERRRLNPLLAILRDHQDCVGLGIDEGTAVIVSGDQIEVLGLHTASIVDGRGTAKGTAPAVRVLRAGMRATLPG